MRIVLLYCKLGFRAMPSVLLREEKEENVKEVYFLSSLRSVLKDVSPPCTTWYFLVPINAVLVSHKPDLEKKVTVGSALKAIS